MGRAILFRLITVAAVALAAISGCTVHDTEIPGVAGPSEFGQSISVTATPDNIVQDGFSQSAIVVTARGPNSEALSNVQLRLSVVVDGTSVAFGSLSQSTVYTGPEGRASAVYTAPLAQPFQAGTPGHTVAIEATVVGSNYASAQSNQALVRVTPPPALPAVAGAPVASVSFRPAAPKIGEIVYFDASASQAAAGHSISNYVWDFGDNTPNDEHGSDGSHIYSFPGAYTMVLGVVDDLGRVGSSIKTIVVSN
jgi:PKD repeat protein